jgi:hypothetical protein
MFTGGARVGGIVAGAAVMALVMVDFVVLGGDRVGGAMVPVGAGRSGVLDVSRVGEEHLVQISTRRRTGQSSKGRALSIRLEGPDGAVLYEDSEIVSRQERYFEFVPDTPGTHRLFLEESMTLLGAGRGNASVTLWVDDHRILRRIYPRMHF